MLFPTICAGGDQGIGFEFGTAGRQDTDAPYKSAHSGTYPIDPVSKHSLAWEENGTTRFAFHVDHPGIRPRLIYRGVRSEILEVAQAAMVSAMSEGITAENLKTALRETVMPYAIRRMGERLAEQAPGVKESNPFVGKNKSATTQSTSKTLG